MNKIINCGCGGKADAHLGQYNRWFVFCESCGTRTCACNTRKKAIEVWNKAMSHQIAINLLSFIKLRQRGK